MDPELYERLDLRMRALERVVHALRSEIDLARTQGETPATGAATVAAAPPDPVPTIQQIFAAPPTPEPEPAAAPSAKRRGSLEAWLASWGMLLAGMLSVLIGTGYFLNLAIKSGWIGPFAQVLLALAVGSALMAYASRRIGPDLALLAEGLIGLGAGIDFLALWASVAVYPALGVPRVAAFAGMVAVTAVLALLAVRRRSERLALMGLLGGYLTPALLASGVPDRTLLAAYLLILTATMLALGVRSSFRWVEALTFLAVACYAPAFALDTFHRWSDVQSAAVGTLFFAVFALAYTLGAVNDGKVTATRLTLLVFDTIGYVIVLEAAFRSRETTLGLTLLVAGAVLLAVAQLRALPARLAGAYLYLGLATATLALPWLLHAASLLDVVIVEAALLVLIATRRGDRWLLVAGGLIFALTGLTLLGKATNDPPQHTIVNSLFLSFVIYVAALGFALSRLRAAELPVGSARGWSAVALVALNVVALAGLSRECIDVLGGSKGMNGLSSEGQFGLSAIWTLYATGLFAAGMARRAGLLRWLGLILFGCTIFKVFVVDLASLSVTYRILSFIGLGIVLVAVSAWYQKAMVRQKAAEAEA